MLGQPADETSVASHSLTHRASEELPFFGSSKGKKMPQQRGREGWNETGPDWGPAFAVCFFSDGLWRMISGDDEGGAAAALHTGHRPTHSVCA